MDIIVKEEIFPENCPGDTIKQENIEIKNEGLDEFEQFPKDQAIHKTLRTFPVHFETSEIEQNSVIKTETCDLDIISTFKQTSDKNDQEMEQLYQLDFDHPEVTKHCCEHCGYSTKRKWDIQRHVKAVHLNSKPYKCSQCSYGTYTKSSLKQHIKKIHVKMEQKSLSDFDHLELKKHSCKYCNFSTYKEVGLEKHIENVHLKSEAFKCDQCTYITRRKWDLHRHELAIHSNSKQLEHDQVVYKQETFKANDEKFAINFDTLKSEQNASIKKEINCDEEMISTFEETADENDPEMEQKSQLDVDHLDVTKHHCMHCDYSTKRKWDIERHIKAVHLNSKPYECSQCSFSTYKKSSLKLHIKIIHVEIEQKSLSDFDHLELKKYSCKYCNYSTYKKVGLEKHIENVHLKSEAFKCDQCSYITRRKWDLQRHKVAIHSNSKTLENDQVIYKQEIFEAYDERFAIDFETLKSEQNASIKKETNCDEKIITTFEEKSDKNDPEMEQTSKLDFDHLDMTKHHCSHCDYSTSRNRDLKRHIGAIHLNFKPLKCNQCNFSTNINSHLKQHVETIHLKLKKFQCEQCSFCTNLKSTLNMHVKSIHLKLKPHKCDNCTYSTSKKWDLKKHIDSVHLNSKLLEGK